MNTTGFNLAFFNLVYGSVESNKPNAQSGTGNNLMNLSVPDVSDLVG
jgi:hypothetical protein